MRKITGAQVFTFVLLFSLTLVLSLSTTYFLLGALPLGDFRGVVLVVGGVGIFYTFAFAVYRAFLWFMPLTEGELAEGSREEFAAHINNLFFLVVFNPIIRSYLIPVPIMSVIYRALGARIGKNSYSAGVLLDPALTEIGADSIIGHDAVLFCHIIEGRQLAFARIQVGDSVTIGVKAVIMPGTRIGSGATVSIGAVVAKGTTIGPGEIWGGVPAKRLR